MSEKGARPGAGCGPRETNRVVSDAVEAGTEVLDRLKDEGLTTQIQEEAGILLVCPYLQ
jgi:hypothetical protein